MINFNRQPTEKSQQEKEFDRLNAEYEKKFGESFGFFVGFYSTFDEALAEIRKCIETGEPQKTPDYKEDCKY